MKDTEIVAKLKTYGATWSGSQYEFPEPGKEITHEEFFEALFMSNFGFPEHAGPYQMFPKNNKPLQDMYLFFGHGECYMMLYEYLGADRDNNWKKLYDIHYFRLGCLHPHMEYSNPVMFTHIYRCPDCGFMTGYDSSD